MDREIDLAEYLFVRLAQLGVGSIHGVPGDYNLVALDYVEVAGLHWVGNANELNAGYAADGYARINGIGALATSFGVGELSAINAIAASYAEKAAVVHIVGTPPRAAQDARACLHHSLGDGNFRVFADMYKSVTVAQANLNDPKTAPQLIDKVLQQCLLQSRPVYLEMPTDMITAKVAAPGSPIDLSIPGYNEAIENETTDTVLSRIYNSKRPLILVDGFTARFDIRDEVNELAKATAFATLTTPFGKSLVTEDLPNFHGIYAGLAGDPIHQTWIEGCDLILRFGPLESDINTFYFTAKPRPQTTVTFEKYSVQFEEMQSSQTTRQVTGISTKLLLQKVLDRMDSTQLTATSSFPPTPELPRNLLRSLSIIEKNSHVDQYSFWLRMSNFFQPGDILLTESGTSTYGGQSFILPENTFLINSSIWCSIGYTLGACQGAALALKEMIKKGTLSNGRTILFIGEGSLQMSAQAISDIIRNKLDVIIFVLNNHGYTVERVIHGFNAPYNDVQPWRHLEAPHYFGAPQDDPSYHVRTRKANNWGDLQSIVQDPTIQQGKGLNMIEVFMDKGDAPQSLRMFTDYLKKRNQGLK